MTISEIKKEASRLNKKNYTASCLLTLIFFLPSIIFMLLPFLISKIDRLINLRPEIILFALLLTGFAYSVFSTSFFVGEKAWYSGRMTKSRLGIKRLIFWYKPRYSIKAFILKVTIFLLKASITIMFSIPSMLLITVNIFLAFSGGIEVWIFISLLCGCSVLLITGLIFAFIINQRYFLAEYLYINNPKLSVYQAIRRSKNLLEGHVFKVIKFKISFIPVFLTSILLLPLIIIRPDYKLSCCILAKELCI